MGEDKGLLEFGGVPLIAHMAQRIRPLVVCVTLVGAPRRYARLGLPAISDEPVAGERARGRRGPLAGIAAALATTHSPWNLILACDLPYLSPGWLGWLLERARKSSAQAVVPRTKRGLEPLAAVYRRECGGVMEAALARGERKVVAVLEELRIERVYPREWRPHDLEGLIVKNMNAPADDDAARKWWDNRRTQGDALATSVEKRAKRATISAKTKGAGRWHPSKKR